MKLLICTQVVDKNHPILGFFHRWIEEFAKHFDEVHVICLEKGEYALPSHVHVYSLGKEEGENKLKYLIRFYRYFARIFFRIRVDFAFFHMGAVYNIVAAPFFLLRKFYKTRFYWWKTHGHINGWGRIALLFTDKVYTASQESFPVRTHKRVIVGHAVAVPSDFHIKKNMGSSVSLLFVGRITPVKKVECAIETLSVLHSYGIIATLRIVGAEPDALYKEKIISVIKEKQLDTHVVMVGPVNPSRISAEYQTADVLINPSETNSIDKVVLEAMAYGLPVVALEKAYGSLLGNFKLAVKDQDARLYAETIKRLVVHPELLGELSRALRAEVADHHSLSTLTNRIFSI